MNRTGLIVLVTIGLAAVAAVALAIGKVTIDPNTPGNRVVSAADLDKSRLARKITYEARRKSVLAILGDLSRLSGVTLKAGHNDLDWQVRDRKMTIAANAVPLHELMRSIARVMHFKWSRTGEGAALSYRLYMDRRAILDGELRREREAQQRAEKRGQFVNDCLGAEKLTDEDVAALKEEHPSQYVLSKTGISRVLGAFFGEVPAAAEALSAGAELLLPFPELSPAAQWAITQLARGVKQLDGLDASQDSAFSFEGSTVRINRPSIGTRPAFVLGVIVVNGGEPGSSFGLPILDPDSRTEAAAARATIKCIEEGRSMSETESQEIDAAIQTETSELSTSEPQWEHGDDPALSRRVKMEAKNAPLDEAQVALSKAAGCSVLSDSFASNDAIITIPSGSTALRTILGTIASQYWYNWAKRGSVIEFQDRDWINKRAAQIPDSWLATWRTAFEEKGVMTVGALAQIAMLTPEQLWENIATDEVLSTVLPTISTYGDVLRFYASLTDAQRKLLFDKSGLGLSRLSVEQQDKSKALVVASVSSDHVVTFTAVNTVEPGAAVFTLNAATGDDSAPRVWRIVLPTCGKNPHATPPTHGSRTSDCDDLASLWISIDSVPAGSVIV